MLSRLLSFVVDPSSTRRVRDPPLPSGERVEFVLRRVGEWPIQDTIRHPLDGGRFEPNVRPFRAPGKLGLSTAPPPARRVTAKTQNPEMKAGRCPANFTLDARMEVRKVLDRCLSKLLGKGKGPPERALIEKPAEHREGLIVIRRSRCHGRPQRAHRGHCRRVRRTGQVDPEHAFPVGQERAVWARKPP
jgi:hypothetical protein